VAQAASSLSTRKGIMQKLIADSHYDIGGYRDVYEDRVSTRHLTTAGGLTLVVAAVADGVGGENKGERASQTTLDAFFSYLEKSRETVIPVLLSNAVQFANKAVYQLQRETGGASTTLTVAVVDESKNVLFIANVGDSRAYICRNKKLTQLTMDHSFANVMMWRGQISPEAARSHPRANVLMRAIGPKEQVEVDLGFYVGTTDYEEANQHGMEGLPLKEGDSILVCSDGLIKDSPKTHEMLITTEEIVRTLNDKEGKKAAQELVSFALGRGPDDNISAAIIQMPDRRRAWRARRPGRSAPVVFLGLVIVSLVVFNNLRQTRKQLAQISQEQQATNVRASEIAAFTPTPSSTPTITSTPTPTATYTPTLLPVVANQAALVYPGENALLVGQSYQVGNDAVEMKIYHRTDITNGFLLAMPSSRLTFDQVFTNDAQQHIIMLRFDPPSQAFLETGGYNQADVIISAFNLRFSIQGCFSINYTESPSEVVASCYSGSCAYSLSSTDKVQIIEKKQVIIDALGHVTDSLPIPASEARTWVGLLPRGSTAFTCANNLVPTPTPWPTSTRTAMSTDTPSGNAPARRTATYTPLPPPTLTRTPLPSSTRTHTPLPTSTLTHTPLPSSTVTLTPLPTPTVTLTPLPSPTPTPTQTTGPSLTNTKKPTKTH
jgi:serine/threonine protein phosphatase PrpC